MAILGHSRVKHSANINHYKTRQELMKLQHRSFCPAGCKHSCRLTENYDGGLYILKHTKSMISSNVKYLPSMGKVCEMSVILSVTLPCIVTLSP